MQRLSFSSRARPKGLRKASEDLVVPVSHWPKRTKPDDLTPKSAAFEKLRTYAIRAGSGGGGQTREVEAVDEDVECVLVQPHRMSMPL